MHPVIEQIEKQYHKKSKIPEFHPGDTVRVSLKVKEGDKERIQNYEGIVIARKGGGLRETFTVRRISFGIGVERTFQIHSPVIQSLRLVRKGKVRRAKLYYLRERTGKKARVQELIMEESHAESSESTTETEKEKSPEPAVTV